MPLCMATLAGPQTGWQVYVFSNLPCRPQPDCQIRRQIQIRIVAAAGVPPLLIRKNNRIFGLLLIFFSFLMYDSGSMAQI